MVVTLLMENKGLEKLTHVSWFEIRGRQCLPLANSLAFIAKPLVLIRYPLDMPFLFHTCLSGFSLDRSHSSTLWWDGVFVWVPCRSSGGSLHSQCAWLESLKTSLVIIENCPLNCTSDWLPTTVWASSVTSYSLHNLPLNLTTHLESGPSTDCIWLMCFLNITT